jgi:DNA uptake protein ComE-like DNA-binding protein
MAISPEAERRDARRLLGAVALIAALSLLASAGRDDGAAPPSPVLRLDPNSAPRGAMAALPEIGPVRLDAILAERSSRPFESPADLDRRVRGIGPATASELAPHLRFDTPPR